MIGYACEVAATTARTRVPALIAEALRHAGGAPAQRRGPPRPPTRRGRDRRGGLVSGPELTVGRGVIARARPAGRASRSRASLRVGRGGAAWRALLGGPRGPVRVRDDRVAVRLWIVARPGQALGPLTAPGPVGGRGHRRAPARARARGGDRPGRRCRGLTASAAGGRAGGSRSRRSSRRTSASAPPRPSSSGTWPRRSGTRTRPTLARELVAAVDRAPRRDRRRDQPARAAVPGHRPGPDGPRTAPYGHR